MRINFIMTLSKLLFFIPLIYIFVCLFIYFYQRNLLYHPGENNYLDEGPLTHKIQKISVNSNDDLIGWYFLKNKNLSRSKYELALTELILKLKILMNANKSLKNEIIQSLDGA